jgi:RNA recognition motif-containing protein
MCQPPLMDQQSSHGGQQHTHQCKVFLGGLSWETSGDRLRAYFENFGSVREAFVSYNRASGRPRGFGFVVFESYEVADKVVASKHTIDRREVRRVVCGDMDHMQPSHGSLAAACATFEGDTQKGTGRSACGQGQRRGQVQTRCILLGACKGRI